MRRDSEDIPQERKCIARYDRSFLEMDNAPRVQLRATLFLLGHQSNTAKPHQLSQHERGSSPAVRDRLLDQMLAASANFEIIHGDALLA